MALLYSSRGRMSGSVGMDTFRKGENGATIMSAKVVEQTNPKTRAQAEQRVKFGTVGKAYSFLKSIVNHSFTGIKDGSKCYQHFMKVNLPLVQDGTGAYAAKGQQYANREYVIASGPVVNSNVIGIINGDGMACLNMPWSSFPDTGNVTLAQLQSLFPDLLPGMELALVVVKESSNGSGFVLSKSRVTIAENATSSSVVGNCAASVVTLGGAGISSSFGKICFKTGDGETGIDDSVAFNGFWRAAQVILSRKGLHEVEYSNASLFINSLTAPYATAFEDAVADYMATDDKFLDQVDK